MYKHPSPIAIQLSPQCLLWIQSIKKWTFSIFNKSNQKRLRQQDIIPPLSYNHVKCHIYNIYSPKYQYLREPAQQGEGFDAPPTL